MVFLSFPGQANTFHILTLHKMQSDEQLAQLPSWCSNVPISTRFRKLNSLIDSSELPLAAMPVELMVTDFTEAVCE